MAKVFNRRNWIISQLRRVSLRYPPFYLKENSIKEIYYIKSKKGKDLKRVKYTCQICKTKVTTKLKRRDHKIPIITPGLGFPLNKDNTENWTEYINRLLCDPDNINIICKNCHDKKTQEEKLQKKLLTKIKKNVKVK